MSKSLKLLLNEGHINELARRCGFLIRNRKVSPKMFLEAMIFKAFCGSKQSLNDHCLSMLLEHQVCIRKQSFDSKFTAQAVNFIKELVEQQLEHLFTMQQRLSIKGFTRVMVQDSTRFGLPEQYTEHFKSYAGRSSKAGMQVQFSYDLSNHKVRQIDIDSASTNDRSYSINNAWIEKGDLIIRDLGYFSMAGFQQIEQKSAFYLSKAFPRTALFEKQAGKFVRLDLSSLIRKMHQNNVDLVEKEVFFSLEEKMPVRAIIELVPESIKEKRLRNKRKRANQNKSNTAMSKDYALWTGINVYLTNTSNNQLSAQQAKDLYRARWQIELVFKTWKSYYHINRYKAYKIHRLLCYLYSTLLLVLMQWQVFAFLQQLTFQKHQTLISLHKYVKVMVQFRSEWVSLFRCKKNALNELINQTRILIDQYMIRENKKSNLGFLQLII